MVTGKKSVALANIGSTLDPATGDRLKAVTSGKRLALTVELVGVQTAQLGQAQGFNLAYSVEVGRVYYNNEKYLYFGGELYEIKGVGKAKKESDMLLHIQRLADEDIRQAVERWIDDL